MPPSILLSLTIATAYGCLFHVLFGRQFWQWPVFWLSAIVGFFAGYIAGIAVGLELGRIGSVPVVAATLGAAIFLGLARYFTAPYTHGGQRH